MSYIVLLYFLVAFFVFGFLAENGHADGDGKLLAVIIASVLWLPLFFIVGIIHIGYRISSHIRRMK